MYIALAKLERLNEVMTKVLSDKEIYSRIIKWLTQEAEDVLTYREDWMGTAHGWAESLSLPERYLELLKEREPLMLVLLAHYCVIALHKETL